MIIHRWARWSFTWRYWNWWWHRRAEWTSKFLTVYIFKCDCLKSDLFFIFKNRICLPICQFSCDYLNVVKQKLFWLYMIIDTYLFIIKMLQLYLCTTVIKMYLKIKIITFHSPVKKKKTRESVEYPPTLCFWEYIF